jgi:hypothetical protein
MFQRYSIIVTDDLRSALATTEKFRREGTTGANVVSISK